MFFGYFQVNNYLNRTIMDIIREKIKKGKKISDIIENIEELENISNILNNMAIKVIISTDVDYNIINYSTIFNQIIQNHINEIKIDVINTIDSLKKELDSIVK